MQSALKFFLRLWKWFRSCIFFDKHLKTMTNFFSPALCLNIDAHVIYVGFLKEHYTESLLYKGFRSIRLIDPYLCCQLVTNKFLFFRTIKWHIYLKKIYFLLCIVQFNSLKLLKIINLTFQILWKSFALSMFTSTLNDFLHLNFKLVLSLLCKDLSKYRPSQQHCSRHKNVTGIFNVHLPLIKKKSKDSF